MPTNPINYQKAIAGILGHICQGCHEEGVWPWEVGDLFGSRDQWGYPVLQVEHPEGSPVPERKMSQYQRWQGRLKDALSNKIIPLCGPCNRKGCGRRYPQIDPARQGARKLASVNS